MIDHFGINCADLPASARFYDEVLEVLGYARVMDVGVAIGYGPPGQPDFWIGTAPDERPGREMHLAFTAPDSDAVRAFHATAIGLGDDPDGNNVEAVTHGGEMAG